MPHKKWYQKNSVRIIIIAVLSTGIALLTAFLPTFSNIQKVVGTISIILLALGNAVIEAFYASVDMQRDKIFNESCKKAASYDGAFLLLVELFKKNAKGINRIAKSINEKGVVPENRWTFDDSCIEVCVYLYRVLRDLVIEGDDIKIYYDKLVDGCSDKIKMVGYANKSSDVPSNYGIERNIDDPKAYYDCKMFKRKDPAPVYKFSAEEVDDILTFEDRERQKGRFSQCMLIPTYCDDKKMIGLLQIFAKKGTKLVSEKDRLTEMENLKNNVKVFSELLVLLQKTEKAALALPPSS